MTGRSAHYLPGVSQVRGPQCSSASVVAISPIFWTWKMRLCGCDVWGWGSLPASVPRPAAGPPAVTTAGVLLPSGSLQALGVWTRGSNEPSPSQEGGHEQGAGRDGVGALGGAAGTEETESLWGGWGQPGPGEGGVSGQERSPWRGAFCPGSQLPRRRPT